MSILWPAAFVGQKRGVWLLRVASPEAAGLTVPFTTCSLARAEPHFAKQSLPDAQRETDEAFLGAWGKSSCARADGSLEGSGAELCFGRPAGSPLRDPCIWGGPRGRGTGPAACPAAVRAAPACCCLPQPSSSGSEEDPGWWGKGRSPKVGRRCQRPVRGPAGQMRGPRVGLAGRRRGATEREPGGHPGVEVVGKKPAQACCTRFSQSRGTPTWPCGFLTVSYNGIQRSRPGTRRPCHI